MKRHFNNGCRGLSDRRKTLRLRRAFEEMRECPIKNMQGKCSRFVDYIMAVLTKQGCHHLYDIEGLQRIVFKMLGAVGERGMPHKGVFDFDESRPFDLKLGNPVRVLFKNISATKSAASAWDASHRFARFNALGGSRLVRRATSAGMVSPDAIPDRPRSEEPELMGDLIELLRKQSTPDLHLVDLFYSIINKEGPEVQSRRFGMSNVAKGRRMIVTIIQQYAQETENWHLLRLLDRFRERYPSRFAPPQTSRRRTTGAGTT